MKKIMLIFIILAASIWAGLNLSLDPGYLLLAYQEWTIEMPLWLGLMLLLLGLMTLSFIGKTIRFFAVSKRRMQLYFARNKRLHARSKTNNGLIAFTEGMWDIAESDLTNSIAQSDMPTINYLAAARAAQEQGALKRRDDYLRQALTAEPKARIAVELTQAQLQNSCGQTEQALATLSHLHQLVPNHRYVLKQLQATYRALHDWKSLQQLLPKLKKQKVLTADEYTSLEKAVSLGLLESCKLDKSIDKANSLYNNLSRKLKVDSDCAIAFANLLIQFKQHTDAESFIRKQLKNNWNNKLITLYADVMLSDSNKQLKVIDKWLRERPNNPQLLYTAGIVAMRLELWGKARGYLERSVSLQHNKDAYRALVDLLDKINAHELANKYYRQYLQQSC